MEKQQLYFYVVVNEYYKNIVEKLVTISGATKAKVNALAKEIIEIE